MEKEELYINAEEGIGDEKKSERKNKDVLYGITETPPWYSSLLLAFQHYMSMFIGSLSVPFLLSEATCMGEDNVGKSELIGTLFLVSGIITLLQVLFGSRLPIVQAGTFALLSPTLSYLALPQNQCPEILANCTGRAYNINCVELGSPEHREIWQGHLTVIQGSIMVAASLEVLLGATGAIGFLTKYIGPLAICPTISLLGLSLFRSAADYAAANWWICIVTLLILCVFSQYLGRLDIPFLCYKKGKGCTTFRYPLFRMFPVILAVIVSWLLCYILTATDALAPGNGGRTDIRIDVLQDAPWIRMPYPGQWGTPKVEISLVFGLFAGLLASIVESIGDYNACARLSDAPPPPKHAINRGITVEGLGCIIAGAFGTGNGTTSTSINIGVIGLTRSGSRNVILLATSFMIGFALINKFGALFVTVPDPIIGATFFVLFGLIVAVGISNLQYVNMNSSRNLFIFGFSFFTGLTISEWLKDEENANSIDTGNETVDSIFTVLLSTSMFVGGVLGFILDNTIPGTPEERGLLGLSRGGSENSAPPTQERLDEVYGFPIGMGLISKWTWTKYVPFCPTYGQNNEGDITTSVSITNDSDEEDTAEEKYTKTRF